jgi:hypothetical protein
MTPEDSLAAFAAQLRQIEIALHAVRMIIEGDRNKTQSDTDQTTAQRIEEYRFLRTEIEAVWSQTYTTLNFLLAFIAIVLAPTFSKDIATGDRLLVLTGLSLITIGGYHLIFVHTGRVWRIATYMRLALEPHLPGIAWETRLCRRDLMMRASGHKNVVDRSLFDGHRMILNSINLVLFVLIVWVLYMNRDLIAFPAEWERYQLLRYSPALIPLIVIFLGRRGDLKRNGTMEKEQILSWQNPTDADGTPIFAMRPGNGPDSQLPL